ncbi:MAG: undecaprenyl-diphosphate phosphatase [Candidatus Pacebacteria bacterium]|nr:undecaprenyl-diphosphate phosphatase [Candidatus Paceibacterota bacterium]
MDALHIIILGIVEGITEFLPVSSTGHLVVVADWLGISDTVFLPSFTIAIQLGAILAAGVLYIKKVTEQPEIIARVFIAFVPTAVVGFTLYKYIRPLLNNVTISIVAIIVGGIIMIVVEKWLEKKNPAETTITESPMPSWKQSLYIGLYQVISFIPGVSRSAATIIGGLLHNMSRTASVEFSFLLAIPTMMAATGYDMLKSGWSFTGDQWGALLLGGIVSFITALVVMKLFLRYVQKYNLVPFGIYRIVLGVAFVFIFII